MYCQKCGRLLQDGEICNCDSIQQIEVPPILQENAFSEPVAAAQEVVDTTLNTAETISEVQPVTEATDTFVDPIKARILEEQAAAAEQVPPAPDVIPVNVGQTPQSPQFQNGVPISMPQNPDYMPGVQVSPSQNQTDSWANTANQAQNAAQNGQVPSYNQNQAYGQNQVYNQNQAYGQNQAYNQNQAYGQNQAYNQNQAYGQNQAYNQTQAYSQNQAYNQTQAQQQYNAYRQNQNAGYQGNPYVYNQNPPQYYQQTPYVEDDEQLKRYKTSPRFIAARDLMGSPLILAYSICVSAVLLFDFIALHSFIHPLLILLCIAGWITFGSGVSAKKKNGLPSTAGLTIGRGVAITMLVIWCILIGLIILIYLIGMFGVIGLTGGKGAGGTAAVIILVILVIAILVLVLGIKHYSLQSRALKTIKLCLAPTTTPRRISIFPAVMLIISAVIEVASTVGSVVVLKSTRYLNQVLNYISESLAQAKISSSIRKEVMSYIQSSLFSSSNVALTIVSGVLGIALSIITAIIYIKAASSLNQFTEF